MFLPAIGIIVIDKTILYWFYYRKLLTLAIYKYGKKTCMLPVRLTGHTPVTIPRIPIKYFYAQAQSAVEPANHKKI